MTARRPQEWPYTSPYYDAMTMDGQEFQHNNSFIKFTEGPLTCVRIKNGSVDRMDVHARSPAERAAFASDQETFDPDITILWVDYAWALAHVHGYSTYLELDPKNWTWLLETMNIHPVFVHLLHTQANQSVKYVTYNEDGTQPESVHIIILQKLLLPDFKMDIVSLYFRYDIKSGKSLGLVLERSPALMVDYMTEYLSSQDESPSFLAALLILLKPLSIRLESELSRVVERIIANRDPDQVSRRIYYHGPQSRQSRQSRQTDLTEYNHAALHVSGINMRRLVFSLERQSKLMGLLLAALQEIASWNETDGSYSAKVRVKDKQLAEAIQFHDGQITSDLEVSYLTDHDLKSRLHAVDSLINARTATNSRRSAEQSVRIATEARRDSTAMKTIAGLTVVYLPSTFGATLFSMCFFSYSDDNKTFQVSREIWQFGVTSAVLTILTIATWVYLDRNGLPKMHGTRKIFGRGRKRARFQDSERVAQTRRSSLSVGTAGSHDSMENPFSEAGTHGMRSAA